jgi:Na+-transporting NADH:ubiquinone oxidoreductase subunit NqrA
MGPAITDLSTPIDQDFSQIICVPERDDRRFLAFVHHGLNSDSYAKAFLSSLLASKKEADTNVRGEQRPCISCNYCQDVCPVGLIPHLLHRHVEREIIEEGLLTLRIFDCIDCNLCSYVCPSKIPVAEHIKMGKARLEEEGFDYRSIMASRLRLKGLGKGQSE